MSASPPPRRRALSDAPACAQASIAPSAASRSSPGWSSPRSPPAGSRSLATAWSPCTSRRPEHRPSTTCSSGIRIATRCNTLPRRRSGPAPISDALRRKPGHAPGREDQTFQAAPEPHVTPTHQDIRKAAAPAETQAEQSDDPQPESGATTAEETVEVPEVQEHEPTYETLLAEEVFAGRAGDMAGRARIYPRNVRAPSWQGALRRARRRPRFATCACAILAIWLAVALAGGLRGGQGERAGAGALAQKTAAPDTTIAAGQPARRDPSAIARRAPAALRGATHPARPRGKATPEQTRRSAARASAPSPAAQPEPPAPAADASPARSPAPQEPQSGGGPFSP